MALTLTILFPAGHEAELDTIEDAFLDDFDDVLGDVEDTSTVDGRPALILSVRDGKSALIGCRRILRAENANAATLMRFEGVDYTLDNDDIPG